MEFSTKLLPHEIGPCPSASAYLYTRQSCVLKCSVDEVVGVNVANSQEKVAEKYKLLLYAIHIKLDFDLILKVIDSKGDFFLLISKLDVLAWRLQMAT